MESFDIKDGKMIIAELASVSKGGCLSVVQCSLFLFMKSGRLNIQKYIRFSLDAVYVLSVYTSDFI